MLKVLLLLVVVGIGVWMLTTKSRLTGRHDKSKSTSDPSAAKTDPSPQAMVRCAHCGVHLPALDALTNGSDSFCGEAHRRLGPEPSSKSPK